MTKFEELQAAHERLLEQSKAPEDVTAFVTEVQREIQNMCVAAEDIPAPRERDQLRAILRFWASYVYDHTGTYPDTTPRPALQSGQSASLPEVPLPESSHSHTSWRRIALAAGAVLIVLLVAVAFLVGKTSSAPAAAGPADWGSIRWIPTEWGSVQWGSGSAMAPDASVTVVATSNPALPGPKIQWSVLTSGPSPFDPNVWVVKLQIDATGGDGNYIFWLNGTLLPDASNNQFTVEGKDCTPEIPVVGVTSGGKQTTLELVIQSPLSKCLKP